MIAIVAGNRPAIAAPLAFNGTVPDPAMAGLYSYRDHVDAPSIGPRPICRPAHAETFEATDAMATWISSTPHQRPFWSDPAFVAEFGRATRAELQAAVDQLWHRAEVASEAINTPIAWPARLSGAAHERTHPQ